MQADELGVVTAARERAAFFAVRYPHLARRIKGKRPVYVGAEPVVPSVPETPPLPVPAVIPKIPSSRPTQAEIIEAVGDAFGISRDDLLGPRKPNRIARPRMACCHLIRELCRVGVPPRPLSLPEIGRIFKRDHTTILSSLRRTEVLFDICPNFLERYERARAAVVGP